MCRSHVVNHPSLQLGLCEQLHWCTCARSRGSIFSQDGALRGCFLRPLLRLSWHRLSQVGFLGKQTLKWKQIEESSEGQGLPEGREKSGIGQRELLVCVHAVTTQASVNPMGL